MYRNYCFYEGSRGEVPCGVRGRAPRFCFSNKSSTLPENLIIPVENTGAVPCGATFEFRAAGVVENPIIIDISTGKFIKLNYTMQAGEVITVSTHFANKKVISDINGNAFAYLDHDSDFIQLETGVNLFRSDAAKNLDNLEMSVYFRPQFLGV